jgi:recombination protein RecT
MKTKELVAKVEDKFLQVVQETGSQLSWVKESGFALQCLDNNPMLQKCDQASVMKAIYNVALTGLTLNPKLAYCYLVPRGNKAVLDISYQGLIYLMTNTLNVKYLHADEIFENDEFDYYTDQTGIKLHHRPNKFGDRGKSIGAFAVAYLTDGECIAVVLNNNEIEAIKKTSQSANSKFSPWVTFEGEMRKKTAVKRLWKIIPKTDKVAEATLEGINIDNDNFDATFKVKQKKVYGNIFEQEFEEVEPVETEENKEGE